MADGLGLTAYEKEPDGVTAEQLAKRFGWLAAHFQQSADMAALASRLFTVRFPAQTCVLAPETTSSSLYLLAEGRLRVTFLDDVLPPKRNREGVACVGNVEAGQYVGEAALVAARPGKYGVTTACASTLFVLTHSQFTELRQRRPSAAAALLRALAGQAANRLSDFQRLLQTPWPSASTLPLPVGVGCYAALLGIDRGCA